MTRRRFRYDPELGRTVEVTPPERRAGVTVMTDAYSNNPVKSIVDGTEINSRAALREHNKRNNVVDIGNDPAGLRMGVPDVDVNKGLRETLERSYSELDA